ncbi:hypothetical protein FACS1894184_16100 [Clostridia bacterium]|nr:hypothetical protein FACS1894184_16100 [Clostridia bacterium]GHU79808.1 hypothetical protein AGMMS49992_32200 [Clostridia bacterium]
MASKDVITVNRIELLQASVHLIGSSPLIISKFSEKAKKQMLEDMQKKPKRPREIRNPWEDAIQGTYWLEGAPTEYTQEAYQSAVENGAKCGFPAVGVKASACSGAYRNKISKDKVSLYGMFHIVGGEYVEIEGIPEMREDTVRLAMNKTDLRYRTWFRKWETRFEIVYNKAIVTYEQILSYFEAGGFAVGLGENRIEKGGIYGGYHVAIEDVLITNTI